MKILIKFYQKIKKGFLLRKHKGDEAIDVTDVRDYVAGFARIDLLPPVVDHLLKSTNKGLIFKEQGINRCTAFARGYASMIANTINNDSVAYFDSDKLWDLQVAAGDADPSYGATLQSALREYHENPQGYPDAPYSRVRPSRNDLGTEIMIAKSWLARGRILYSGVRWTSLTWRGLVNTGIYRWISGKGTGAHALIFVGYDDERKAFKLFEPMLLTYGENQRGVIWLPYSEFGKIMSVTVLHDLKDKEFTK